MSQTEGFQEFLNDFVNVKKGERLKTFLLFSWIFLFICVYYVLRPIRRGMVLDGLGNDKMPFVYLGTALVTGLVVFVYSKFTHAPRRLLIGTIYGIFLFNLIAWWVAFHFESAITSGLFWIWLDVFSIMGVTVFWMYVNDLFDSGSAKRLFGILTAGGGLGAILGSSITAALVQSLGATNMLLVAAGIVALTLGIFLLIDSHSSVAARPRAAAREFSKIDSTKLSSVLAAITQSRFLTLLTLLVCCERITPDLVQYLYHEVLHTLATGREAIAALDANLERWRAICEFTIEFFFVSAVLKRVGTTACLTSSAAAILAGLTIFAISGNPFMILFTFHTDEAVRHSWFKAAKELTYTVTSKDVLYGVKPVIEMFFYRLSRGLAGVLIYLINTVFSLGVGGLVVAGLVTAGAWAYCGVRLSREYRRLEASPVEA